MLKFGINGLELKNDDQIAQYLNLIKSRGQGFYEIIDNIELVKEINKFVEEIKSRGIKKAVVLGIGGSSLGAICLKQAFGNLYDTNFSKSGIALEVLDNIDPVMLIEAQKSWNLRETIFLVITKSGGTPETLAQFLYFKSVVVEAGLDWTNYFVFVTDPKKGLLRKLAQDNPTIKTFAVPENVGGRFSVLTAVGLLPAALMGVNLEALLRGAVQMRTRFLSTDIKENWPFQLALAQYSLYQAGFNQTVLFPYVQKLGRLADWYRQLLAESIGKELNRAGEKVSIGITPVISIGATDQHSQNQLYNEGPNDKLYIFLENLQPEYDMEIPFESAFESELGYLKGIGFNKLLLTEMEGTIQSLLKKSRPIIRLTLDKLSEENMGELLMLFEASIAFLGELFEIDAYNQPGVELSKILTKEMLNNK